MYLCWCGRLSKFHQYMKIRITASNIRGARITLKTFKESSNFELIARSYQLSTAGIEHESLQINRVNGVSKNTSTQADIEGEPGYCFAPFSLTCYTNSMVSGGGRDAAALCRVLEDSTSPSHLLITVVPENQPANNCPTAAAGGGLHWARADGGRERKSLLHSEPEERRLN